mgnify:CR=1 FL=1
MGRKKPRVIMFLHPPLFFLPSLIAECGSRENQIRQLISNWYTWIKRLSNMPIQMGGKKIKRLLDEEN